MIQRFAPLFTVAIHHSYYAGNCEDFEFVTPRTTARTMLGGKVLARTRARRLHVVYEADSPGNPVNSLDGKTLLFGLRLTNSTFSNFTEPVLSNPREMPFYTNANHATSLDAPLGVSPISGLYSFEPQTIDRPLTLRLTDAANTLLATQLLPPATFDDRFDFRRIPEGLYRIDEDAGAGSVAFTRLFLSPELQEAGVWGVLAIKIDAAFYASPPTFTLDFVARQEQLKYFVVASNFNQSDFDQLNVVDSGFNDDRRPQLNFDKILPGSFLPADISPALLGDGTQRIALFRSQSLVARHERGFRRIQLNRNGETVIPHLPFPSADRPRAQFIIHLSKPFPSP